MPLAELGEISSGGGEPGSSVLHILHAMGVGCSGGDVEWASSCFSGLENDMCLWSPIRAKPERREEVESQG